jgi:2-dehydro-3-deoxyphosphogluconate aldolase / (4S)-4-hydroxy-2-oxoglutarate aldolase
MQIRSNAQIIEETGLIAIVRLKSSEELINTAKAIAEGGVKNIEFTMTTPNALDIIKSSRSKLGEEILLGVGTVLDMVTAREAILSGAQFIVTPTLNREVIEMCHRYSVVVIPGAYSPTEILTAWEWGADMIKLFPADVGGPNYLKAIRAPLPQVKIVPVGGIDLENISSFIKAGANAIAIGSNLVNTKLVEEKRFDQLSELASKFIELIKEARKS